MIYIPGKSYPTCHLTDLHLVPGVSIKSVPYIGGLTREMGDTCKFRNVLCSGPVMIICRSSASTPPDSKFWGTDTQGLVPSVSLSEIPEILLNLKYPKVLTPYFLALASFVYPGVLIKCSMCLPGETAG